MIYLTYNDQPTGVYFSQVTDVCNFINSEFNCHMRLVALISIRNFLSNRKKIKKHCPGAIVLPMYPKNENWRKNIAILSTLFLFIGNQNIWSRGLFATNIALELKKKKKTQKVVFDARGAYKAEFEEYLNKIVELSDDIYTLEKNAIDFTDYRLAISESLINYWKNNYNFSGERFSVIPCTLAQDYSSKEIDDENLINETKKELNITLDDVVFVYSGSSADWQSLNLIDDFMIRTFENISNTKLIVLSNANIKDLNIYKKFSEKIIQLWVTPEKVFKYLSIGDYGLIIREHSITNEVASPTKFAEYLSAGLKVLISESIGDFSTFVKSKRCGEVIDDTNKFFEFQSVSYSERKKNNKLARDYFSKLNFIGEYNKIVHELS